MLHGRLIVKFIDDKFIPSTIKGNIHFSSYEYFKNLEESSNDKGKSDKNENAEYRILDPQNDLLFVRPIPESGKTLGARNLKGAKRLYYKGATYRTSYPKEDKEYGISSFAVIDSCKYVKNEKIIDSFINDVNEISNNRRVLIFSEDDFKKAINDFATKNRKNNKAYHIIYGDVEYTDNNNGKRNGFQKDLKYARQHEWRIRTNMDILNDNGDIFLSGLDIELADSLNQIMIVNQN